MARCSPRTRISTRRNSACENRGSSSRSWRSAVRSSRGCWAEWSDPSRCRSRRSGNAPLTICSKAVDTGTTSGSKIGFPPSTLSQAAFRQANDPAISQRWYVHISASTGALGGSATFVGWVQSAIPPSATQRVSIDWAPTAPETTTPRRSASTSCHGRLVVIASPYDTSSARRVSASRSGLSPPEDRRIPCSCRSPAAVEGRSPRTPRSRGSPWPAQSRSDC